MNQKFIYYIIFVLTFLLFNLFRNTHAPIIPATISSLSIALGYFRTSYRVLASFIALCFDS